MAIPRLPKQMKYLTAEVLCEVEISADLLLIFYLVFLAGDAFSNVRSLNRYVELLSRYVNNDADAITALSER